MAGRVDLAATTHAPASPLNMMKPVPAAMAPSGASGPEKTSVANETAKTRPPKATVAPMPSACAASPSAGAMNGSEVSSCCWTGFVFDEGSPTARGGRTMRALTLRDRDERAAIHATPTPTRVSPDPSPRPESRSEAAAISRPAPRDLSEPRRFPGGAESDARDASPLRPTTDRAGGCKARGERLSARRSAPRHAGVRPTGASICEHGRRRSKCKECGGASICEHGRRRSKCKECGGAEHGRRRSIKECCEHGRQRSQCKECGGGSICEHGRVGRQRSQCKECGGGSICEHGRRSAVGINLRARS